MTTILLDATTTSPMVEEPKHESAEPQESYTRRRTSDDDDYDDLDNNDDDDDDYYYDYNDDYDDGNGAILQGSSNSNNTATSSKHMNFMSHSVHNAVQKMHNLEQQPQRTATQGRDDRATAEQVLDPRTRLILFKLLSRGFLEAIDGCLSTGKEANVYYAKAGRTANNNNNNNNNNNKEKGDYWYEVEPEKAWAKIGQTLRNGTRPVRQELAKKTFSLPDSSSIPKKRKTKKRASVSSYPQSQYDTGQHRTGGTSKVNRPPTNHAESNPFVGNYITFSNASKPASQQQHHQGDDLLSNFSSTSCQPVAAFDTTNEYANDSANDYESGSSNNSDQAVLTFSTF
mmetsp:Transcript_25553/g.60014  ORF Transcript_25553/g.60014 Transcript_25553/m.60014 type:complete len:342 (+) Transcript_25553:108-1133(+)